jgi:hypothetical protein
MIDPVAATVAAVIAAQLMEAPAYLQRALDMPVRQDIFDEGGSILRASARWRRLAGWVGHAALAIAIVLLSATFFAAVAGNDNLAWWGVFAGAVHGLLGGLVVGAFVDLHPRMPDPMPAPGVFYRHYGRRDVITFVVGHRGSASSPASSTRSCTPSSHPPLPSDLPAPRDHLHPSRRTCRLGQVAESRHGHRMLPPPLERE